MKGQMKLISVPEIGAQVRWSLISLSQEDAAWISTSKLAPQLFEIGMRFWQVFTECVLALEEVGRRIATKPIQPQIKPEPHNVEHLALDLRIVVVEIWLVMKEAVPVISLGHRVVCPVGGLAVTEDDSGLFIFLIAVAPNVVIALG